MICSWLLRKVKSNERDKVGEDIAVGLAVGCVLGVMIGVIGIASTGNVGLISLVGVLAGILVGVVVAIAIADEDGILAGIIAGIVGLLTMGVVVGFAVGLFNIYTLIIALVVIEVLYWIDKTPIPKKENKWVFILKAKFKAGTEVAIGLGVWLYVVEVQKYGPELVPLLQTFGYYAFMFLGVVGIVGVWLWINSLKYRNVRKRR